MRNLLISLTFIFALILGSSTDAFSQEKKGGGSLVDVFGLAFNTAGAEETAGIGTTFNIYNRIEVHISEGEESEVPLMIREFPYIFHNGNNISSNNSSGIELPTDIDAELDGRYYVEVWMNGVLLGGQYKDDF